ncbi:MAG: hypothetical protein GC164_04770 [Phycisphaera sp.]|nr:hypothetical protein [Phycisphaera sp.]
MAITRLKLLDPTALRATCAPVVPERLWQHLAALDPEQYAGGSANPQAWRVTTTEEGHEVHMRAPAKRYDHDFALSVDLQDQGAGQLELSFIVVNDLKSTRYTIDHTPDGQVTLLGTAGRNIDEELRALRAGLGPCQVRKGLGLFSEIMPRLEALASSMGYINIILEPLTYHNAVMYESHGFAYLMGRKRMVEIDREFRVGGRLRMLLDGSSPFREPVMADSPRGRSWAIHDGILEDFDGNGHLELKMVKAIGKMADHKTYTAPLFW